MHILIGLIALQTAWSGRGQEASQKGALAEMAQQPIGAVLGTERSAQLTHVTADGAEWIPHGRHQTGDGAVEHAFGAGYLSNSQYLWIKIF